MKIGSWMFGRECTSYDKMQKLTFVGDDLMQIFERRRLKLLCVRSSDLFCSKPIECIGQK